MELLADTQVELLGLGPELELGPELLLDRFRCTAHMIRPDILDTGSCRYLEQQCCLDTSPVAAEDLEDRCTHRPVVDIVRLKAQK